MQKRMSHQITLAGLFLGIGLILPYCTAHAFGLPGTVLLPMHIPILLCGLLCGPKYGGICGLLLPVLSSILTGMPAFYPMLPIMTVQLITMGIISGLLYQKLRLNMHLSILAAMLTGWVMYGLVFAAVLLFSGSGELKALIASAAVVKGIPGMLIQLVLIPVLITALNRCRIGRQKAVDAQADLLCTAKEMIKRGSESCVVIQNGEIVYAANGRGVSPLLRLYREEPDKLAGAIVADKIIGKAAAMIITLGGAKAVYGEIMSVAAQQFLEQQGISVSYGRCVDVITAQGQKGICPIEKTVLDIDDAWKGLEAITGAIALLMKKAT